jgi:hypothetical protein
MQFLSSMWDLDFVHLEEFPSNEKALILNCKIVEIFFQNKCLYFSNTWPIHEGEDTRISP